MFEETIHFFVRFIEAVGVAVIIGGALYAAWKVTKEKADRYDCYRRTLGRSILLGLEFLVVADIINTVAVEPTIKNVSILGLIVLIRTFLSFSLGVELEGKLPWRARSQ